MKSPPPANFGQAQPVAPSAGPPTANPGLFRLGMAQAAQNNLGPPGGMMGGMAPPTGMPPPNAAPIQPSQMGVPQFAAPSTGMAPPPQFMGMNMLQNPNSAAPVASVAPSRAPSPRLSAAVGNRGAGRRY